MGLSFCQAFPNTSFCSAACCTEASMALPATRRAPGICSNLRTRALLGQNGCFVISQCSSGCAKKIPLAFTFSTTSSFKWMVGARLGNNHAVTTCHLCFSWNLADLSKFPSASVRDKILYEDRHYRHGLVSFSRPPAMVVWGGWQSGPGSASELKSHRHHHCSNSYQLNHLRRPSSATTVAEVNTVLAT